MHIMLFVENTHLEWLFDLITSQSMYDEGLWYSLSIFLQKLS